MVPDGWELCSADELCHSISVGIVIKPSQYYVSKEYGIRAFRSANVREGYINDSDWVYLSEEGHNVNKKSHLFEGDVVIVRTGYPGTACVITKEFEGLNAIDIVIARPDKSKVNAEYLCSFTNSEYGKSQVLNLQAGMAQKHLNVGAYKKLLVKLPSLLEQNKIAKILTTWDKAITTTEKLLANSQQQKKALMQQLLMGKKRFNEFKKAWINMVIKNMGKVVSGGTPDTKNSKYWSGNIAWMTPTDVTALKNRYIKNTARKITEDGVKNSSATMLPSEALLVCTRATVGLMSISTTEITTNQGFKNIVPNDNFDVNFLYYLFAFYKNEFIRHACGSTFLELSKKDFEKLSFECPEYKEQKKIAAVLSFADNEIENLQFRIGCLKQEKKALMQQLLTGKRRVIV